MYMNRSRNPRWFKDAWQYLGSCNWSSRDGREESACTDPLELHLHPNSLPSQGEEEYGQNENVENWVTLGVDLVACLSWSTTCSQQQRSAFMLQRLYGSDRISWNNWIAWSSRRQNLREQCSPVIIADAMRVAPRGDVGWRLCPAKAWSPARSFYTYPLLF